jgi:hypothetical protein
MRVHLRHLSAFVLTRDLGLPRVIPRPRAAGAHEICLNWPRMLLN